LNVVRHLPHLLRRERIAGLGHRRAVDPGHRADVDVAGRARPLPTAQREVPSRGPSSRGDSTTRPRLRSDRRRRDRWGSLQASDARRSTARNLDARGKTHRGLVATSASSCSPQRTTRPGRRLTTMCRWPTRDTAGDGSRSRSHHRRCSLPDGAGRRRNDAAGRAVTCHGARVQFPWWMRFDEHQDDTVHRSTFGA
jgi:hypothetical protein